MVKESVKCVSRKFQECFKNVLMKFCFMILLLHGSHRSYPRRRRACFLSVKFKKSTLGKAREKMKLPMKVQTERVMYVTVYWPDGFSRKF